MILFIDIIGAHNGLQNYDESFHLLLKDNEIDSIVISNYKSYFSIKLLQNHYSNSLSERLIKLIANYLKYLLFILPKLKKSIIIYNSFGLGLLDSSQQFFFTKDDEGNVIQRSTTGTSTLNEWHYTTMVVDRINNKGYIYLVRHFYNWKFNSYFFS